MPTFRRCLLSQYNGVISERQYCPHSFTPLRTRSHIKICFYFPALLCLMQAYDIFVFYFDNNCNKDKKGRAGRNAQRQTKSIIGLGAGLERASMSFDLCY
jgi:hypothetical protein